MEDPLSEAASLRADATEASQRGQKSAALLLSEVATVLGAREEGSASDFAALSASLADSLVVRASLAPSHAETEGLPPAAGTHQTVNTATSSALMARLTSLGAPDTVAPLNSALPLLPPMQRRPDSSAGSSAFASANEGDDASVRSGATFGEDGETEMGASLSRLTDTR